MSIFYWYVELYFEFVPDLTKSSLQNRRVASRRPVIFSAISRVPPEVILLENKVVGGVIFERKFGHFREKNSARGVTN